MVYMRLRVDLDADQFGKLNEYISRESNMKVYDGQSRGLKVSIEGIEKASGNRHGQEYKGIEILVEDFELTKPELNKLMDIIYTYKDSK